MSIPLVCIIGISTVFVGLIFLIAISYLMSYVCGILTKNKKEEKASPSQVPKKNVSGGAIANKQEIIAATCAVIAEELGTDVSNIKVTSFKKL